MSQSAAGEKGLVAKAQALYLGSTHRPSGKGASQQNRRHCEERSDEAIHGDGRCPMDGFASLAMTAPPAPCPYAISRRARLVSHATEAKINAAEAS